MDIADESTIRDYYDLRQQIAGYADDMRQVIMHPDHCLPFIQPGRLVYVKHNDFDFGWGVVVDSQQRRIPRHMTEPYPPQESHIVHVLINVSEESSTGILKGDDVLPPGVRPPPKDGKSRMEVVPTMLSCLQKLAMVRIQPPKDVKQLEARKGVAKSVAEIQRRFPDGLALLDPMEHMGIKDDNFKRLLRVRILPVLPLCKIKRGRRLTG